MYIVIFLGVLISIYYSICYLILNWMSNSEMAEFGIGLG